MNRTPTPEELALFALLQNLAPYEIKKGPKMETLYEKEPWFGLLDAVHAAYGVITIPKNTMVFHSNHFLETDLDVYEPIGFSMKMQDLRKYSNSKELRKIKRPDNKGYKYPLSKANPRLYLNFTPAGNIFITGNISAGQSVYVTTEDLNFFQFPNVSGVHLKNLLKVETSQIFKEYIEVKNNNTEKKLYCGFVLSTDVDATDNTYDDREATRFIQPSGLLVYPEILLLDGFDKFKTIKHYDIWDVSVEKSIKKIVELEKPKKITNKGDTHLERVPLEYQKGWINSKSYQKRIANYGASILYAYILKETDSDYVK